MATVSAQLSDYRQSPRKVRVVANMVRGKNVKVALNELAFLPKRAGGPVKKLIESALANAKNLNINNENLYIKEIRVDKGTTLRRMMPRARGRGFPINKRSSHVLVVLDSKESKQPKAKAKTKAQATPASNVKK